VAAFRVSALLQKIIEWKAQVNFRGGRHTGPGDRNKSPRAQEAEEAEAKSRSLLSS
jgi:hypothetical protein